LLLGDVLRTKICLTVHKFTFTTASTTLARRIELLAIYTLRNNNNNMSSSGELRERRDVGSKPVAALVDTVPITKAPEPSLKSSLPEVLKFPLVLILSISISELLYPLDAEFNRNALLDFSRPTFENEITPVVAVGLWKVLELTLAWFAGFDGEWKSWRDAQ